MLLIALTSILLVLAVVWPNATFPDFCIKCALVFGTLYSFTEVLAVSFPPVV